MTSATLETGSLACPVPVAGHDRIVLGHGSGGKLSAALLREHFLPHFDNYVLRRLGDAGVVSPYGVGLAMSTDTFVVSPLEFAGGNIGTLAVNGTVNDLAMMGARPYYMTAGFVLEEGLPLEVLDRVIDAMAGATRQAGVTLIAGDTKVVERGKGDGLFINTTGLGLVDEDFRPEPQLATPGDAVIVSGPIGVHGMAIMAAREGIAFETELASDTANLYPLVELLRTATEDEVHVLRDPTRGGAASALNEIAASSHTGIEIDERSLLIPDAVAGACEMLGLDPLYVANEGIFLAFLPERLADLAVEALRQHPLGRQARRIGRVVAEHPSLVVMRTAIGASRIVDLLPGDQLPRIC
jgi:hydrogenase expression/formation protein HypE